MARGSKDKNSAGSQFFICQVDYPYLNGDYASFGKVISGIEVVDAIADRETDVNDKPVEDIVMKSVKVETWGKEYPEPEKIQ